MGTVRQTEQGKQQLRRAARPLFVAVACAVALTACRDSGLPDRNLPLRDAMHREHRYPAYQPTADNAPVAAAGRHWIGSLPVETIPQRMLVPVAGGEGAQLYALRDQQAPYSRLYRPVGPDRWQPFLRLN
jgi:hypothetical protein